MPGYLVASVEVTDPDAYAAYRAQVPAVVERFGGRFLVRGGTIEAKEGDLGIERLVILEFPTIEAARAFYDSPDYAPLIRLREASTRSRVALVEGLPTA
ncbi:DUF1330 domain-containing protein [Acidisphaera rubrifaciens]|uniref:DUF1330 domain-containing protein n=1 Tax=Acidisphaera rubrifaciens HS-AP3 TaxID=1231350 RepID=A0A0D6P2R2_9PROT|nr:DUF1330 domain-containing protein [Acidisphaera rubrifaciens]GAN76060.1 hypothetical protein Asru_0046_04 [Acidisphaera rubrifaciens HS-AP3]